MSKKPSHPTTLLADLTDKHQFDALVCNSINPRNSTRHKHVGEVVLRERVGGLIQTSPFDSLKSDDIRDKGLRRLEKPIKRKRSSVYKLGK